MPGIIEILIIITLMAIMIGGVWLVAACLVGLAKKKSQANAQHIQQLEDRLSQLEK